MAKLTPALSKLIRAIDSLEADGIRTWRYEIAERSGLRELGSGAPLPRLLDTAKRVGLVELTRDGYKLTAAGTVAVSMHREGRRHA